VALGVADQLRRPLAVIPDERNTLAVLLDEELSFPILAVIIIGASVVHRPLHIEDDPIIAVGTGRRCAWARRAYAALAVGASGARDALAADRPHVRTQTAVPLAIFADPLVHRFTVCARVGLIVTSSDTDLPLHVWIHPTVRILALRSTTGTSGSSTPSAASRTAGRAPIHDGADTACGSVASGGATVSSCTVLISVITIFSCIKEPIAAKDARGGTRTRAG